MAHQPIPSRQRLIELVKAAWYDGVRAAEISRARKTQTFRHWLSRRQVFLRPKLQYHTDDELLDVGASVDWSISDASAATGICVEVWRREIDQRGLLWPIHSGTRRVLRHVDTDVLQSLLDQGLGVARIGNMFGVSHTVIVDEIKRRSLTVYGTPKERQSAYVRAVRDAIFEEYGEWEGISHLDVPLGVVEEMYGKGIGPHLMAWLFGTSPPAVSDFLRRRGIPAVGKKAMARRIDTHLLRPQIRSPDGHYVRPAGMGEDNHVGGEDGIR